jgi:hypothetical protein
MRFELVSGLHVDDWGPVQLQGGENLIMVGDISIVNESYLKYITYAANLYDNVYVVFGLKEYSNSYRSVYKYTMDEIERNFRMYIISNALTNVHFLHKSLVEHDDVVILGCTLWGSPTMSVFNELLILKNIYTTTNSTITVSDIDKLHRDQLAWLRKTIELYDRKPKIIVTYSPLHNKLWLEHVSDNIIDDTYYQLRFYRRVQLQSHHPELKSENTKNYFICSLGEGANYESENCLYMCCKHIKTYLDI